MKKKLSNFCKSKFSLLVISVLVVVCLVSYVTYTNHKLSNQQNNQQRLIDQLNNRISHEKEQVNTLVKEGQTTYKTLNKLQQEVASLTRRMDEVQQYQLDQALSQKRDEEARPSFDDLNGLQTQLGSLQFQIKDLNQKLYELNKANITATVNNTQNPSVQLNNLPSSTPPKAVLKPLIPPFAVLGIESRGGELFLSVAPSKSASLSQIKLLRTGDSFRGWQLKAIKTNAAVFVVGTRQQVINIR